jgi:hypothetical protein
MTGKVTDLVAHAVGKHQVPEFKTKQREGCFYGWVIVTICIFAKIFKVQGQNNVMSYTVPHLLEDFELSHAELGGLSLQPPSWREWFNRCLVVPWTILADGFAFQRCKCPFA